MRRYLLLLIFSVFILGNTGAQPNWQKVTTAKEACAAWPEKMEYIFQNLNLDYPGLEKVKKAWKKNDLPKASELLLEYYKNSPTEKLLKKQLPAVSDKVTTKADSVLQDIYTFQLVTDKVPRLADGHLDWTYKGPEDDIEWAWALNRHYPMDDLLAGYYATGNPKYVRYMDSFIKDWIIESWPYPAKRSSTEMWRGLEVSFRVKVWSQVFYEFIHTDYISPATRLLILSSLPDHADYARKYHAQGNWLTMEMSGLATVATSWPEFQKSPEWLEYTINTMTASLKEQVYPDGVQTELTSHYHRVALNNFSLFYEICHRVHKALPAYFTNQLEQMWNYLALTLRPSGYGLLNNDADLDYNRENVKKAAQKYNRKDWEYIATNGQSGVAPENGPSFIFPWAGHFISRSGYGPDAQWSFFDIGPWGTGHQHNDKLHLSVSAFGRDLLVDGGRFAYRGAVADKFRKYATGSQSHNVILVDDKGQAPGPLRAEEPLSEKHYKITPDFDYAWASFDNFKDLDGKCEHMRRLFYVRGDMWVVVDQITTDRPRKIEALWHFHPDCKVIEENGIVTTNNERGNLQIIPVGNQKWKINLVKGQEKPVIQGWYSKVYNTYAPNTAAIFSTNVEGNSKFIWVLFPSEKVAKDIKAEIVSESDEALKLRVYNSKNDEWIVNVPF